MNRLLAIELNGKWSCSNDGRIIVTRTNTYSFLHNSIEFTKLTYSADKSKADNNNVKRIWNKSDVQCEYFLVLCMNTTHAISRQCVEWPSNGFVRLMETRWARERDLFIRCFCHVFAKAKISSECFTIISTHSIHIIYNDMNDFEQVQYFPISLAFQIVYYFSYTLTLTLGLHSMSVITLHIHP